jgi:hypothetical protein
MSAGQSLPAGEFYHGTKDRFEPGEHLTATGARQANPYYPRHVWATAKPLSAATHATKHGREYWDTGRVYQVEPLLPEDVELDPLDNGNKASFRSPSGFRVVRDMGSPAQLWERPREADREAGQ